MLIITGFLAGIISGMGIGGGTILIPALTIFMATEQKTAQAINLIYFIPTAIVAVITHIKEGNIDKQIIKPLIIYGIIGAVAGSLLMNIVSKVMLHRTFGIFLFILGGMEIWKGIKARKDIK